jgi:hypothetical protein
METITPGQIRREAKAARLHAVSLCHGSYQHALVWSEETWSGSSLRGKARHLYSSSYARSKASLLRRLHRAEVPMRIAIGSHNRQIMLWGQAAIDWYLGKVAEVGTDTPGQRGRLQRMVDALEDVQRGRCEELPC